MEEREPVALWKLLAGFVAILAAIELADNLGGWWTIGIGTVTYATFTFAAWRWSRDSRDGADWVPKPKVIEEEEEEQPPTRPGELDVTLWHRWP